MAHGQPDYGMYTLAKTIYRMSDMGELAARLGSAVNYDRRGDLVFLDSFEEGLGAFEVFTQGAGGSVTQSQTQVRTGGYSAKLVCGSDIGRTANLVKYQPLPILGKVGYEFSFTMTAELTTLTLWPGLYNGTHFFDGMLRFYEDDDTLKYQDSAGAFQTLDSSLALKPDKPLFHTMKLVIDWENSVYVRALLNERSFDLTDIAIHSAPTVFDPCLLTYITAFGANGVNATIYVDDFIVTQNEP